jgi:hypothetical protein
VQEGNIVPLSPPESLRSAPPTPLSIGSGAFRYRMKRRNKKAKQYLKILKKDIRKRMERMTERKGVV